MRAIASGWIDAVLRRLEGIRPLAVIEVGCGTRPLLADLAPGLPEGSFLLAVDLDEDAIREASPLLLGATCRCADAAFLPAELDGRFHLALVGRPDLLARPQSWQAVLVRAGRLLAPGGLVALTAMDVEEAVLAAEWLEGAGFAAVERRAVPSPGASWLVLASGPPGVRAGTASPVTRRDVVVWDEGEVAVCDLTTGLCLGPAEGT